MTEEQRQEALRLYHAGVRVASIHKFIGATDGQVKRYIYKVMKLSGRNMKHSTGILNEIKRLRSQGKRGKDIETAIGMKRSQINYLFRVTGMSYRELDNSKNKKLEKN